MPLWALRPFSVPLAALAGHGIRRLPAGTTGPSRSASGRGFSGAVRLRRRKALRLKGVRAVSAARPGAGRPRPGADHTPTALLPTPTGARRRLAVASLREAQHEPLASGVLRRHTEARTRSPGRPSPDGRAGIPARPGVPGGPWPGCRPSRSTRAPGDGRSAGRSA